MKIIASSSYLPENKIENKEIAKKFNIEEGYIEKRTGIKQRYFAKEEKIEEMATKAVEKLIEKTKIEIQEIEMIIVATTSTDRLMPGISNYIQKELKIRKCICLDILAGCSGYINAVDIAQMYINSGKVNNAIVVGVEILSIYKYAVTETVKNIQKLLEETNSKLEDIKYIVPHQSNLKIITAIANRLEIKMEKIYTNIENVGNTFCASIPIALEEMEKKELLQQGDKIILIGYGGGLNTGSILLEI